MCTHLIFFVPDTVDHCVVYVHRLLNCSGDNSISCGQPHMHACWTTTSGLTILFITVTWNFACYLLHWSVCLKFHSYSVVKYTWCVVQEPYLQRICEMQTGLMCMWLNRGAIMVVVIAKKVRVYLYFWKVAINKRQCKMKWFRSGVLKELLEALKFAD